MDIVSFLIPHTEPTLLEQPRKGAFHNPTDLPQAASVLGIAAGNHRTDAALPQRLADLLFGVVRAVGIDRRRPFAGAAARTPDRLNGVYQRNGHGRVVDIRTGVPNGQRRPLAVHDHMPFRAVLSAIRGVWTRLRPPKSARTEQLSIAAADQSMASAWPNSSSKACQTLSQTPAACQSRSRRQHVMPHPQPNSRGRYSQGMPVLSTNRMPVSAPRLPTGGRPPLGLGVAGGRRGSICSHNSSVSSGLAIVVSSLTRHLCRPNLCSNMRFC